nr:retrotransposon protein, putative, unclassified [Tanacetum cinerariifolium]
MCDFSYDALCTHWLSLKEVTLLCSVSRFIVQDTECLDTGGFTHGKRAIGTKWVYRNKRDKRGFVVRNKARLVAQGHRKEKGIDYDKVFAPVARIEVIRLFLAYASFMDFTVYQMDVKSAFIYGTIEEEVYVSQPLGFVDPEFPDRVYKMEKALYGLHQAPRAWYETLSTYLLDNGFRRGTIDKTLFIKQIKDDILLVQVYVDDIIFGSTKRSLSTKFEQLMHKRFQMSSMGELTLFLGLQSASTPMETHKPLSKDAAGTDVDVHLYRSMIGSLMYLTSSRLDIMFAQCKKQTIVANSTTEAEYIAASNYCGQVLWLQNQLLDYGYNFMQTKIHVDNESVICVVNNHVYHSKTRHIEIRHHFIRDSYEKRLIEMVKIHTDYNVADLLTKAFDVTSSKTISYAKQIHAIVDGKAVVISESLVRSDLLFNDEDGGFNSVGRSITTDASLEAAHANYNILKTQTTAMPNVDIPQGMDTGGSPRRQDTMECTSAQTRSERVLEQPNEPPLIEVHTSGSGEEKMEYIVELMDTVPHIPYYLPLTGGYTPGCDEAFYHKAFITLTKRVKKLETHLKQKKSRTVIHSLDEEEPSVHIEDSPKQERMIEELDKDEDINLSYFKGMKYEDIMPVFERVWDQVHTFLPKDFEIKKEVLKRSGFHLQQESLKKQKLDQQTEEKEDEVEAQADSDQKVEEMKLYMRLVPDEDIAINDIPLATKP